MHSDCKEHREFVDKLYRDYSAALLWFAKSQMRDDYLAQVAVQEVFLLSLEKCEILITKPKPEKWVYESLRRIIKSMQREQSELKKRIVSLEDHLQNEAQTTDEVNLDTSFKDIISDKDFEMLKRKYVHGYTYEELAEEIGIPTSTVGMRLKRAKDKFREKYKR